VPGLVLRLLAVGSVIAAVVCVILNVLLPSRVWWCLFVLAGLGSGWVSAGLALKKRRKPLKAILWQLVVVTVLLLAWDKATGFWGWSMNFVLPILYTASLAVMLVLTLALRLKPQDYLISLSLNLLIGLLPLVPLLKGWLWVVYPSVVCVGASVVVLAATLIFYGRAMRAELARRMHL
jgi:hypothetical protein